jgi:MFS family permease
MDQPVAVAEGMSLQNDAVSRRVANPWLILAVAFLVSVAAVMAQFAAPPLMPILMDQFGVGIGEASSLMSIFSITGLLLALPAGLVLQRFGPLVTGAIAMLSVIAGCVLAATTDDYGVLLISRAVQGVGTGLIGVTAPAVVAAAFPPERRGTPMGIWAMWVPVGGLIMYLVAPTLAAAYGWAAAWWLAAAVAAVGLVAYTVVLRRAGMTGAGQGSGSSAEAVAELRAGLGGRDVWLLVLSFALFAMAASAPNTFTTTFLAEERGLDLTAASLLAGLILAGAAIGSILGGTVSDRIGSRRRVIAGGLVLLAALLALPFLADGALIPVSLLCLGLAVGAVPAAVFASVPEVVPHPHLTGAGMAGVMLGQNAGFVIGPLVFVVLLPALGWAGTAAMFGLVALLGALAATRIRLR